MNKILDISKAVWSWFYDRTVIWCIFAFFVLMGWGQIQKNQMSIEVQEEELSCKTSCLPSSHEYLQLHDEKQCWCYKDVNTLVKTQ